MMSEVRWNSGIAYAFSINKTAMWISGIWPLQNDNLFCKLRWTCMTAVELTVLFTLAVEISMQCADAEDLLESFLILQATMHAMTNRIFPRIYREKLAENLESAIKDWFVNDTNKDSREIMKKYAYASRLFSLSLNIIGYVGCCMYFASVYLSYEEYFDPLTNETMTKKSYVLPAACLFGAVSNKKYMMIVILQMCQIVIVCADQCNTDSFFFSIIMHLCGQLDLLRISFSKFAKEEKREEGHQSRLAPLIQRHCELMGLVDNVEDTFNFCILLQLLMNTVLIGMTGFRLILSIRHHNHIEMIKSLIFIQFSFVRSLLYTYAGDMLESRSELIFSVICKTSWYKLPSNTAKDLIFIMMRASTPLRISAGKFFYISRITLMDILKVGVSYISFLQVTIPA